MKLVDLYLGSAYILGGIKVLADSIKKENKKRLSEYNSEARVLNDIFYNKEDFKEDFSGDKLKSNIIDIKTIDDRVIHIKRLIKKGIADPRIRKLAISIVSKKCGGRWCIKERDYRKEVEEIYKYIRSRVRYVRDILGIDTYQSPQRTHEFGGGDCDDFTAYSSALLMSIGYPVKIRVIQTIPKNIHDRKKIEELRRDKDGYNHIYLLVAIPPKKVVVVDDNGQRRAGYNWIPFDASIDKYLGWQAPASIVLKYKDYDLEDIYKEIVNEAKK